MHAMPRAQTRKLLLLDSTPSLRMRSAMRPARTINLAYLRLFNYHRNYTYASESIINGTFIYAEETSNEHARRENGIFECALILAHIVRMTHQNVFKTILENLRNPVRQRELTHAEM